MCAQIELYFFLGALRNVTFSVTGEYHAVTGLKNAGQLNIGLFNRIVYSFLLVKNKRGCESN